MRGLLIKLALVHPCIIHIKIPYIYIILLYYIILYYILYIYILCILYIIYIYIIYYIYIILYIYILYYIYIPTWKIPNWGDLPWIDSWPSTKGRPPQGSERTWVICTRHTGHWPLRFSTMSLVPWLMFDFEWKATEFHDGSWTTTLNHDVAPWNLRWLRN